MNTPATTRPALPATPASPEERLQAALRRLELNRAALRRELVPLPDAPAIGPDGRVSSLTDPLRRWWRDRLITAGRARLMRDGVVVPAEVADGSGGTARVGLVARPLSAAVFIRTDSPCLNPP